MQEESKSEDSSGSAAPGLALWVACLAAGALLAFGYARDWGGEVASEQGRALAQLQASLGPWMGAGAALLLVGLGGLLWASSKARPGASPRRPSEWLPVGVVLLLVGLASVALGRLPAAPQLGAKPYEVEVIGQQFEWLVRYPGPDGVLGRVGAQHVHALRNPAGLDPADEQAQDDVVRRQVLWLPLDEPCVIHLRSLDVLHSFNVDSFRLKRDVLPGYPSQVSLTPCLAGEYELSCAALCGLGHYRMSGKLRVAPRPELEAWLATTEPWF